jgi:NADH:ubiquinone oxidoreductase subunit E
MANSSQPVNVFSEALQAKIKALLTRFETKRSSILPVLHAIQDEKDWISDDDVEVLERDFGLSAIDVREVLTFYSMYRQSPPKPWRLEVCNSISCWLLGSKQTLDAAEKFLDDAKKAGKELPFSCREVECLGYCGRAPVAFVNKDRYLDVTPDRAVALMKEYSTKPLPTAAQRCSELRNHSTSASASSSAPTSLKNKES